MPIDICQEIRMHLEDCLQKVQRAKTQLTAQENSVNRSLSRLLLVEDCLEEACGTEPDPALFHLWLSADDLVGQSGELISSLGDRSPNGHVFVQTDNGLKPSLLIEDGIKSVSFPLDRNAHLESDDWIASGLEGIIAAKSFTLLFTIKKKVAGWAGAVLGTSIQDAVFSPRFQNDGFSVYGYYNQSWATVQPVVNAWEVWTIRCSPTRIEFRKNGQLSNIVEPGVSFVPAGGLLRLGGWANNYQGANHSLRANLTDLLLTPFLSDVDMVQLEQYLLSKLV